MRTSYNLAASTLIGSEVLNPEGEKLGDIKEIMLDADSAQVSYAVLGFGGFLGISDKLFAVPWQAFSFDEANRPILNVDKETLEKAEGFDPENWPDMADREWGRRIYRYYGLTPYGQQRFDKR